jgi:predicted phosphodiesterase
MKIQLASDLHLELLGQNFPTETLIRPAPDADVLVLAGDIHCGLAAIERFKDWPVPVLYVAGNHEFYGHAWEQTRADLRQSCAGTSIRFLDNSRVDVAGVRFLGCTLWTDFSLSDIGVERAMRHVEQRLLDFQAIHTQAHVLTPQETLLDHEQSVQWLQRELEKPHAGGTVVISHHAPHRLSIHPRYRGDPLNAGFASDLTELLVQADLWLHGHVHGSFDYRVGYCRVVANPAGYIENRRSLQAIADADYENKQFDPSCVIEITTNGVLL